MVKYLIIIEKTATGFSSYAPDIPGCIASGQTKEEVEQNMYEAIKFHLEGLEHENIPIPQSFAESELMIFGQ